MMLKLTFSEISTAWTFFIIFIFCIQNICGNCIHDQVVSANISIDPGSSRWKREGESLFEPLKIFTYKDEFDITMSSNAIDNIENGLRRATRLLSKALKVQHSPRKFILQRTSCTKIWESGPNEGKCAQIKSGAEYCSAKNTEYVIPDTFLDQLDIYTQADTWPFYSLNGGDGVDDYNFILFVIARSTSWCTEKDVQAYASYCRTDKSGRPIAGLLNVCPEYFRKAIYSQDHYFNVMLHEMVHAIGFSTNLFENYKGCAPSSSCDKPKSVSEEDENGITRLQFAPVINRTQQHFSCNKENFGAPMALQEQDKSQLASHWHPLLMFTSIMTPSFSDGDTLSMDKITLSLLESTGWYEVDYAISQPFLFGKGKDCEFGTEGSCAKEENTELCVKDSDTKGCDPMNLGVTSCVTISPDAPCGVFRQNTSSSCATVHEEQFGVHFRVLEYQEMCFIIKRGDNEPEPECSFVKCKSKWTYEVLVNETWIPCGSKNETPADGIAVHCVPELPMCMLRQDYDQQVICNKEKGYVISIRMYFSKPTFDDLVSASTFKDFKITTVTAISRAIGIPVAYIVNATLSVFKQLFLDFSICPPTSLSNAELGNVVSETQAFLQSGAFAAILKGYEDIIISSTDIMIDPADTTAFNDQEGLLALSAIPVVCGLFLFSTCIASLFRMYIIHKHRPRRSEPVSSNISKESSSKELG